jgi:hypothetical protein
MLFTMVNGVNNEGVSGGVKGYTMVAISVPPQLFLE